MWRIIIRICVRGFSNVSECVWRQVLLDSYKHPIHRLIDAESLFVKFLENVIMSQLMSGKANTHSRRKCYVSYNPVSKVGHPSQTDATNWLELNIDTRKDTGRVIRLSRLHTYSQLFLLSGLYFTRFYFDSFLRILYSKNIELLKQTCARWQSK